MTTILVVLALIAAAAGAFMLTQATTGAGLIALACFLGILARLAQARGHHTQLKRLLGEEEPAKKPDDEW